MGLLDYLRNAKENYDRLREEQKKRSLLSQLGRAASAIIPDPLEQKISRTLSPIFSGAKESARQAALNTASSLPIVGPAVNIARGVQQYQSLPQPARAEIEQNVGATAKLAGQVGLGIFNGVGNFGATQMDRVFGFNGQKPLDFGGIAKDTLALPRDFIIRPTARAATGFATSGISRLADSLNGPAPFQTPESIPAPTSKVGQFFLGTDPIKSVRGIEASAPGTAESLGYSPGFAKNVAPFLGVGLMASDLVPINPKKAVGKVAADVAGEVAEKTAKEAAEKAAREAAAYAAEQTAKRAAAETAGNPGILQRIRNFGNVTRQGIADATVPLTDPLMSYERATGANILPEKDVRLQIDRVLRADTLANQFIKDSGIERIIQDVPDLDEFDQYLIARQSADVAKEGIQTGRDLTRDANLVQALGPKYEQFAQQVTQYSHNILDYITENGLIAKEAADALKVKFPNYVPLNRVFSEVEQAIGEGVSRGTRGVANLSKQTVVQKLKGSAREIANPLQSLLEKTYDAFRQGERNKAGQMLGDYVNLEGNPLGLRNIADAAEAEMGSYFTYMKNGVKQIVEAPPEVAAAARSLKVQQMDTLLRILAVPNRIFKAGTTGLNVPFVAANAVKDLWTSINLSPSALNTVLNPIVFLKGLTSALKHDELFDAAMRDAALQTSFDIARNQANQTLKSIRSGRSVGSKILYTATRPSELLRAVEDVIGRSEEMSRLIQYEGISKKLLKEGATPERARLLAADAARNTTANFARRGTWGNVLGAVLPYFNSSVQGSRALIRAMKERPARTSAMIATSLFMPVAAATAWNNSDPERKKVYNDIEEFEKEGNIILVPPNPKQDEQGRWNVIKIPMPAGLSSLTIPIRRAIEGFAGSDPVSFGDIAQGLIGAVSPINVDFNSDAPFAEKASRAVANLVPQAIKPTIEAVTNTNLFTGRQQVPQSLQNLPPELQVRDYTSGLARIVGNALNVSPIKTEEFIKGTFGQVGSQALNLADSALAGAGVIPKSQVGGESITENFQRRFGRAYGGAQDSRAYDEVQQYVDRQDRASADLKARAQQLDAQLSALPPAEAAARFEQIRASDPKLADKLKDVVEERKLGLTSVEKAVKGLNVEQRAQYVYDKLQSLETDEQRAALWADYTTKKIISENVSKRLLELLGK